MPRACNVFLLAAGLCGFARAQTFYGGPAVNSASYDTTALAQGSIFVVFGFQLGPDKIVYASAFPLPDTLAGTSVKVAAGGITLNCPMVYTSSAQVAAILPSKTPIGLATIKVTSPTFANEVDVPNVQVVASSPGIYAVNSQGDGPGVFDATNGSPISFTASAKAGEVLTLWATGLGPIEGSDAVAPTAQNIPGVEVFAGSQSAKVLYAGRSPCCAGLDQISFEVPTVSDSCYVPVAVRSGGIVSNFVTLAVHGGGETCADSGPAVPSSILAKAETGDPIKGGAIMLGPMGVLSPLGFNLSQFVAHKLSVAFHTTVSEKDAEQLISALQHHKKGAVRSFALKYAKQWDALSVRQKEILRTQANLTQVGALAVFGTFTGLGPLLPVLGGSYPPPVGTCTVVRMYPNSHARESSPLDAGSTLGLNGPGGAVLMRKSSKGRYQGLLGPTIVGPNVPAGPYSLSGQGGKDLGAFSASLNVASPIVWSNKAAIQTVDRSQPITMTWSGGDTAGYVLIGGFQKGPAASGFLCTESTERRTLEIPALVLSQFQASTNPVVLFIGPHPLSRLVTIPGVDLAYFMNTSSDTTSLPVE